MRTLIIILLTAGIFFSCEKDDVQKPTGSVKREPIEKEEKKDSIQTYLQNITVDQDSLQGYVDFREITFAPSSGYFELTIKAVEMPGEKQAGGPFDLFYRINKGQWNFSHEIDLKEKGFTKIYGYVREDLDQKNDVVYIQIK